LIWFGLVWFGLVLFSFGMKIVAVETSCQAMGAKICHFVVAPVNNIRKHIPNEQPETELGLNIAIASSVMKLLHVCDPLSFSRFLIFISFEAKATLKLD
jgi:hypothetical protein